MRIMFPCPYHPLQNAWQGKRGEGKGEMADAVRYARLLLRLALITLGPAADLIRSRRVSRTHDFPRRFEYASRALIGEVAERFKAPVLKTGKDASLSRVRIPSSPPSGDPFRAAHVSAKHLRNRNRPVRVLVVFHNGDQGTADGDS